MSDAVPRRHHRRSGRARLNIALLCVLVAACSAALAAVAWTRPKVAVSLRAYRQMARLTYSAPTPPTSVYGSAGLVTGEPVYLKVVNALQIAYAYRIEGFAPSRLHGTEQLVAEVGNGQGVVRDLPLQPVTPFGGDSFSTTTTLPIATLQAIAASFDSVAGGLSSSYTVSIVPHVSIGGRMGAAGVATTFDSPTLFTFSPSILTPGGRPATPAASGAPAPKAVTGRPLTASSLGHLRDRTARPADLAQGITVADARIWSLVALAAALGAGLIAGLPLLRRVASEHGRPPVTARLGSGFVDIVALPGSPVLTVVELSALIGLVKVGRQLECPVLRLHTEVGDQYVVVDSGTMYRFAGRARELGRVRSNGSATHDLPGAAFPVSP